MTPNAAVNIATRILDAFPQSPPANVWEEELAKLDEGTAGTTLVRVRREHDHPRLSVRRFLDVYRSLDTTRPDPTHRHADRNAISHAEYLERVARRSANGDPDATEELERWERWLTRKKAS